VAINNNHCTTLHAHIGNEKKGFIKTKVMKAIITQNVEKITLFHSPMCTNQPLRVMELGAYGTNTFPTSLMQ
jgi:hypothetical protein